MGLSEVMPSLDRGLTWSGTHCSVQEPADDRREMNVLYVGTDVQLMVWLINWIARCSTVRPVDQLDVRLIIQHVQIIIAQSIATYILVIDDDIVYSTQWLYVHVVVCGQVVFGGGGVLVGNDTIGHGEKLLYSAPALFWCVSVVTQPHHQPGEEVGSYSTEAAVVVCVCVCVCVCVGDIGDSRSSSYLPPWAKLAVKNCILAVKNLRNEGIYTCSHLRKG